MEFHFDVNYLLPDEITVIDSRLYPFKAHHVKEKGVDILKRNLEQVIDKMGMASSRAQNLNTTITSYGKLSVSDHRLYLLKDPLANDGKGAILGLIKVGKKRLFLVDIHSQQLEVNPLCVLDFYVHEHHQRSGYGHRLFTFMLEKEAVKPQFLAYDRPSSKFINFLKKHFDLQNAINQMNKFVVFDLFFRDLSAVGYVPRNRRFVSSAPSDSRMHSTPDSRLVSSASTFGKMRSGTLTDLRINDKTSTDYASTLTKGGRNSPQFAGLPPKPPGRASTYRRETNWSRRNASHVPFGRESTYGAQSPDHRKNLYSRHSYTGISKGQNAPPQETGNSALATKSDSASSVHGRNEQIRKQMSPNFNKTAAEMKSSSFLPAITNDRGSQSQHRKDHSSYSVDKMYKQATHSNNASNGTSWNLFGVPANLNNHSPNRSYKKNQSGFLY